MEAGQSSRGSRRGTGSRSGSSTTGSAKLLGLATGGRPPNVFTTLARNRGLFRRWLWFAGGLMPGGKLPRARHRAGDPPRRPQHRLRLRVGPPRAARRAGRAERRGDRAGARRGRRARLDAAPGAAAARRRRAARRGRIGDELWAELRARARRAPADRALPAGRPLRDAGDDPEHAAGRARPGARLGAPSCRDGVVESLQRQALPDHRRRQRDRPRDRAGRRPRGRRALPDRHQGRGAGASTVAEVARGAAAGSAAPAPPTSPTTRRSSRWPPRSTRAHGSDGRGDERRRRLHLGADRAAPAQRLEAKWSTST